MSKGLFKIVCVTSSLALIVGFGTPQLGKRKENTTTTGGGSTGGGTTGGGSGSTSSGGGSSSGGGLGRRVDPPPVRTTTGGGGGTSTSGGGFGTSGGGGSVGTSGGGLGRRNEGGGGGTVISGGVNRGPGRQTLPQQGGIGQRKQESRSGPVQYGTANNMSGRIQIGGVRIDRAPRQFPTGLMQGRVFDQERVGLVHEGYRHGYYHYNRGWRDDNFCYPFYMFTPYHTNYRPVVSPWYYYASLPPYINSTRVIIINNYQPTPWMGTSYRWNRPDRNDRFARYSDVDYTLNDIVDAFERYDRRAISRLAPRGGQVNMYIDGQYNYSLAADDFFDIFADGIDNARTTRYEIVDVQQNGRGGVRVLAMHEFTDPWNNRARTYHQFFLEQEGRDYVIREFGTSNSRM